MPQKKKKGAKGTNKPPSNEEEGMRKGMEKLFSAFEDVGAGIAERIGRPDGLLEDMEQMARSGEFGEEGRDIVMEERELRRKAEMELQKKLQLITEGKYEAPAPFHDGDQTPVKGHKLRILKNQWGNGMDYNPANQHLSDWMRSLYNGDYSAVMNKINETDPENLANLVEKRESLLNVSGIFHVVIGARSLCGDHEEFRDQRGKRNKNQSDHLSCFLKLLELGARIDAKDVAGHTPLHHCLTIYANDVTKKMAKILLKRGADPNIKNRFGATALFEPTMHMKLDSIELLLKYGADPNVVDNDGISCFKVARAYPKVLAMFSKSMRTEAKSKRKEMKEEAGGSFRSCTVCADSSDSKRCTGCFLVWYCGTTCQQLDWANHKESCKETRNKFIPVQLKTEITEGMFISKSHTTGKITVPKDTNKPRKKNFMVKVQVPMMDALGILDMKKQPLNVYNEDKSCHGYMYMEGNEAAFGLLKENVEKNGFKGIKGFFYATWDDNIGLKINATDIQPVETW